MSGRVEWVQRDDTGPHRLDVALSSEAAALSRAAAQKAIRSGSVTVNGSVVSRPSYILAPGDVVEALLSESASAFAAADIPVEVVYEDAHIAVVDKPAGIAVHPGTGHISDTLVNGLLARYPQIAAIGSPERPGVVHRLDKDTSGLIVFALTRPAYDALGKALRDRTVKRTYTALVHGHITPEEGAIEAPVGRDPADRTRQAVAERGKPARTQYRLVRHAGDASLLQVQLETGRMHQIRVHMAAIGFPVVGDQTYGKRSATPGLSRQFLHASRLEFDHPVTGEPMKFESALPDDLQQLLDSLG
jgi:23S rRNA pseudouridine1911/1915/1917 synthase